MDTTGMKITRVRLSPQCGMSLTVLTWALTYTSLLLAGAKGYGSNQYCNMETFNATCKHDQVILMKTAKYGRMEIGRCVKRNLGYLGCSVDVLVYMDRICSGIRRCEVSIPNPTLYATQPCPEDTTPYLDVSYECVQVATSTRTECSKKKQLLVTNGSGYIASTITKQSGGLGSVNCPWVVRAQPGQRISLSLLNLFRTADSFNLLPGFEDSLGRPDVCYEFASLRDGEQVKSLTSCGGEDRVSNIYLSRSNEIRIQFVNPNVLETLGTYLLKYEAVGCPRLRVPKDGWAQVDGETAEIRCNFTDETWYLTCKGTTWMGQTGNCTRDDPRWHLGTIIGDGASFPYGILIVVAIGVALGVFFGGILLTVVVIYMRRRHRQSQGPGEQSGDDTEESFRISKFAEGGGGVGDGRLHWSDQHKYRPTILEEHCPRDATSSFSTVEREHGGGGGGGGGGGFVTRSTFKSPGEDASIYYDKEINIRSATGTLRQHIYESPHLSS